MKNIVLTLTALLVCLSCANDDNPFEDECLGVIDYAPPGTFQIIYVDQDGNNLLENGFYDVDRITASFNGENALGVFENPNVAVRRDTVLFFTGGFEIANRWLLHLSETDIDTLDYTVSLIEERQIFDGKLFCGTRAILDSASYNGTPLESASGQESIVKLDFTVVKSTSDD